MSLYIDIKSNDKSIYQIVMTRIVDSTITTVSTYRCELFVRTKPHLPRVVLHRTSVSHDRAEGSLVLVQKFLNQLEEEGFRLSSNPL